MNWDAIGALGEIVGAAAVVASLAYLAVQIRHGTEERERQATLDLVHSFQTPEFAKSLYVLGTIPEDLSKDDLETHLKQDITYIYVLMNTWESLGILVFRGELSLFVLDDFFSGPIVVSWRRLRSYVDAVRADLNRDTYYEWFQWIAERLVESESAVQAVPAHIEHRAWTPPPLAG